MGHCTNASLWELGVHAKLCAFFLKNIPCLNTGNSPQLIETEGFQMT